MKEIWKPIPGLKNYEASNLGRVRSIDHSTDYIKDGKKCSITIKGRIIKLFRDKDGYDRAGLYVADDSGKKPRRSAIVHRLVWEAFKGPIPTKYVINHLDFNRANNTLENLECCTAIENDHYSMRFGRKSQRNLGEKEIREIRNTPGIKKMADKYKLDKSTIWHIKKKNVFAWVNDLPPEKTAKTITITLEKLNEVLSKFGAQEDFKNAVLREFIK